MGSTNSDLAFIGNYVIQGSYNGYQIWDISNPSASDAQGRRTSVRRRRATSPSTRISCSSRRKADTGAHRLRRAKA